MYSDSWKAALTPPLTRRSAELARLLDPQLAPPTLALALARAAFLVARSNTPHDLPSSLPALLSASLAAPHAPVRARTCAALSGQALAAPSSSSLAPWLTALGILERDPARQVRDAACRALGLLAKAEPAPGGRRPVGEVGEAVRILLAALAGVEEESEEPEREGESGLDPSGALWTLANCCDLLQDGCVALPRSLPPSFRFGRADARVFLAGISPTTSSPRSCRPRSTASRAPTATSRCAAFFPSSVSPARAAQA